jgi:hypothetical protein
MHIVKRCLCLTTILCFLNVILSLNYLWAQETSKKIQSDQQPQITIDSALYDAGKIDEGKKIIHAFTIKNTGTAELTIKDVKAG